MKNPFVFTPTQSNLSTWKPKKKKSNIPARFRKLCAAWHGGQSSIFYAVSSSNGLYRGNIWPANCETEKEWDLHLWTRLLWEITDCLRLARLDDQPKEVKKLSDFKKFVDKKISKFSVDDSVPAN
jgi:hypothetical protein